MPDDFVAVWERPRRSTLQGGSGRVEMERLYLHERWVDAHRERIAAELRAGEPDPVTPADEGEDWYTPDLFGEVEE